MSGFEEVKNRLLIDVEEKEDPIVDQNNNQICYKPSADLFKEVYRRTKALNVEVCLKLEELVQTNKISFDDFDELFIETVRGLNENDLFLFDNFEKDQSIKSKQEKKYNVQNLISYIRKWKNNYKSYTKPQPSVLDNFKINDELVDSKSVFHSSETHKFDYQLYVGHITNDMDYNELKQLFERYGNINYFSIRNEMVSQKRRDFGFVGYANYEDAMNAKKNLNGYEFLPNKFIRVHSSESQMKKVLIQNIPSSLKHHDLKEKFSKYFEGLDKVLLFSSQQNDNNQLNMCYLEFSDRHKADFAKQKLDSDFLNQVLFDLKKPAIVNIPLTKIVPMVIQTSNTVMSSADYYFEQKKLFVKNIDPSTSEHEIYNFFVKFGQIALILKKTDFAFVEYVREEDALTAMHSGDKQFLGSNQISVAFARLPRPKIINPSQASIIQTTPSKRKLSTLQNDVQVKRTKLIYSANETRLVDSNYNNSIDKENRPSLNSAYSSVVKKENENSNYSCTNVDDLSWD